jgi:hypothetical protein
MNREQLAAKLDGREYCGEITKEEAREAMIDSLVVVYGYSDDNVELRGAITEEIGAYEGTTLYFNAVGLLKNRCIDEDCPYHADDKKTAKTITAIWGRNGYSWTFETDIPHATFEILEDGEKFCRGIVFAIADLAK